MPIKKLKHPIWITQRDITGFYNSMIPADTLIYPASMEDSGVYVDGWCFRFIFDTIQGATAHNSPTGNIRTSVWYEKGCWDKLIKPYKEKKTLIKPFIKNDPRLKDLFHVHIDNGSEDNNFYVKARDRNEAEKLAYKACEFEFNIEVEASLDIDQINDILLDDSEFKALILSKKGTYLYDSGT